MQNENNYYKNNLSPPRLTREDIVKAISGILIVFAFIAVISLFANIGGGSSNDSNPGSNSGGSSSDGSENDSGTTITYNLSGIWHFNANLSYDNELSAEINFTSNDMECSKIIITNTGYLLWVRQEDDMYMQVWSEKNSWDDDYSKIIDFGSTPQTVSREFYEWFTANAFKYGTGHAGGNGN